MKRLVLSLILATICGISAFAYDFSAVCESGQTLYYNITSNEEPYTVEITNNSNHRPTGNLIIPSSVTYNSITYSVTKIGDSAFFNCSGLSGTLTIPNSVTSIGNYAFYNCRGLTSVTIGNGVTIIRSRVFENCSGLTSVAIGNSVTSIGEEAFSGCSGLVDITIPFVGSSATATTASASTLFGYLFGTYSYTGGTAVVQKYRNTSSASNYEQTYYIPSSLRSVIVTGGNMLYGAFYGCSMLTSVTIGNSVTSIGNYAFSGCSGLTAVYYTGTVAQWCGITFNSQPLSNAHNLYINNTLVTDLVIPNTVTEIKNNAFQGASCLTSVSIPSSVTSIGQYAFQNCSGLSGALTIPNSVTSIGQYAFSGCNGFTSVSIPNSVTSIGKGAFYGCSGLVDMTIPFVGGSATATEASESTLFGYIFDYVTSNITGTTRQYYSSSRSIYAYIPSSLRSVTVTGGNMLYGAFFNCSMLTSVTIGNSVTSIGWFAFFNCSGLTDIYANPTTPPTVGANAFWPVSATLWVPCGSAAAYSAADGWSRFTDIRETGASLLSVSSANPQMGTASITLQPSCSNGNARIVATPNEGYRFVQWNDGNTDNPRSLYVSSPVEYVASFEALPTYTITAVSADEATGTVTGGGIFYEGETATLTATPAEGYRFATWNDGNTDNPRPITVTEDATYTATFAVFHTITVTSADETQGTASGSGDYAEGSQVEISATPAEHHHFTQWNDGNTDNPRTITVTGDATYTAEFAIDRFTITVESNDEEMGTVSESGIYDYGTEIQISATPAEGYGFASWNDGNTDNPRTVIVSEDITYTATFGAWRTITVLSADETMGTVSGSGVYVEGAQVEISAEAVEHYHFAQWNDGNTENPRTITVAGDSTFTASFAIDRFTITVESADEAMGTVSESNTYDYGTEIQISATAAEHYHFVQWNDGNTDNPRTITVTGDATYRASFAIDQHTITVESDDETMGTVNGSDTYDYGAEIQISASARDGYQFVSWNDGNTDNPRTITVVADATYIASFVSVTGIEETAAFEIILFPNPATDILNITSSETISEIEIVNVMGQVVKRFEVNANNAVCDVEDLTSGVYVVRIYGNPRTSTSSLRQAQCATVSGIIRKFVKE